MDILLTVVLVILVIFVIVTFIHMYNNLIGLRNRVQNSYAQIDVQLKRRNDLIPNLVETVKGYASHEKGVLEEVTQARTGVMNATTVEETSAADNQLTGALKTLFAVAENYPDLKANSNFQQLQNELSDTEDKIAYARQFYNDVVLKYNNACQQFPSSMLAKLFRFKEETYFETPESETAVPEVKF
jgi:LemA protein